MRQGLFTLVGTANAAEAESILQRLQEADAVIRRRMEESGKTFNELEEESRGKDEFSEAGLAGDVLAQQYAGLVLQHLLPGIVQRARRLLPDLHPDFARYLQEQRDAFDSGQDQLVLALDQFFQLLFAPKVEAEVVAQGGQSQSTPASWQQHVKGPKKQQGDPQLQRAAVWNSLILRDASQNNKMAMQIDSLLAEASEGDEARRIRFVSRLGVEFAGRLEYAINEGEYEKILAALRRVIAGSGQPSTPPDKE